MKKHYITIIAVFVFCITVIYMLIKSHSGFPQDEVVFEKDEYILIENWDILINENVSLEYDRLPVRLNLHKNDVVTMTTVLERTDIEGGVLWFKTEYMPVRVLVDGQEVYTKGMPPRAFGKMPGVMWHFIEIPYNSKNISVSIVQQSLNDAIALFKNEIHWVALSTKSAAINSYFNKNFGITFLLAIVCLFFSFVMTIFSLFLMTADKKAVSVLYFFLIFAAISALGICTNPLTAIYISNTYFIYCATYISHLLLFIVIMQHIGCYYENKYSKWFSIAAKVSLIILFALVVCELTSLRSFSENLIIINVIGIIASFSGIAVTAVELICGTSNRRFISYGYIILGFIGLYEIFRFYILEEIELSDNLYYGAAAALIFGSMQVLSRYFRELRALDYLKARNEEISHFMEVQSNYYQHISEQIYATRKVMHDFSHYRAIIYGAVKSGNKKRLEELLSDMDSIIKNTHMEMYCDSLEINAVISRIYDKCRKSNVEFSAKIQLPSLESSIFDMCIIIGNMLDNALSGALSSNNTPFVRIYAGMYENDFIIRIENSCSGEFSLENGEFKTTKPDKSRHGIGISIVRSLVEKYHGEFFTDYENFLFKATVLFPDLQIM